MSEKSIKGYSISQYAWIVALLIGIGGQFLPQLGLLVPFIMITLIVMSLFKGKYWCGNFCPHGSLFDNLIFHLVEILKSLKY